MTSYDVKNGATFEEAYQRFRFAPLVALALIIASRIKATGKTAGRHGAGPVYQ